MAKTKSSRRAKKSSDLDPKSVMATKRRSPRIKKSSSELKPVSDTSPLDLSINRRGRRKLFCAYCNFKTHSPSALKEHKNSHSGKRPFLCEQCKKSFTRRSALWNHRRLHSDQRPFSCQICTKSFKWKNSLVCHLRVHAKNAHKGSDRQAPEADGINQSIDDLKSRKTTYAGVLRRGKNTPVFKYGKSNNESTGSDQSVDFIEYEIRGGIAGDRAPVPNDLSAADFLVFESAEDQKKFEMIFNENELKNGIESAIRLEPKLEENFEMDGVEYEVIACGIEPMSPEECLTIDVDMQPVRAQSTQPIMDTEPGPSGIKLIMAAAAVIGFEEEFGDNSSVPNKSPVRVLPVEMW